MPDTDTQTTEPVATRVVREAIERNRDQDVDSFYRQTLGGGMEDAKDGARETLRSFVHVAEQGIIPTDEVIEAAFSLGLETGLTVETR